MGEIKNILVSGGEKQFDDDDVVGVYITKSVNHFSAMLADNKLKPSRINF